MDLLIFMKGRIRLHILVDVLLCQYYFATPLNEFGYESIAIDLIPIVEKYGNYFSGSPDATCTLDTCFDLDRCSIEFKIFIYPECVEEAPKSPIYSKILSAIRYSKWFTSDPSQACLFIPSMDTLDRDISSPRFNHFMDTELQNLPYWYELPTYGDPGSGLPPHNLKQKRGKGGRNHLIFNMFTGTYPLYTEDEHYLPIGEAIMAKASCSKKGLRQGFDIAIPLIHPTSPSTHLGDEFHNAGRANPVEPLSAERRSILLSFKGKRYMQGIGSSTRDVLHYLHNGRDIILLTTCKHNRFWMFEADARCAADMQLYDQYDYQTLLNSSQFCLVPRGRRLDSFRLLEVLKSSCIPVILSENLVLPFSDVIDWNQAVVRIDEDQVFEVPSILHSIPLYYRRQMQQQVQRIWRSYFSSIETITLTIIEIVRNRIAVLAKPYSVWNSYPGALSLPEVQSPNECFQLSVHHSPRCQDLNRSQFTLVIPIRDGVCTDFAVRLAAFGKNLFRSQYIKKVVVVWLCEQPIPNEDSFRRHFPAETRSSIVLKIGGNIDRFVSVNDIPTPAVFMFTLELNMTREEVDAGFRVWLQSPDKLVGFDAHFHRYDNQSKSWTLKRNDEQLEYSLVDLSAAFYHRQYHELYRTLLPASLLELVHVFPFCEDVLFNSLVGHLTQSSPVQLRAGKSVSNLRWQNDPKLTTNPGSWTICFRAVAEQLGNISSSAFWTVYSSARIEDANYHDPTRDHPPMYLPLYSSSSFFDLDGLPK